MKKHGIYVKEHKKWNTKTIWNEGHVMRTYRRQPKTVHFKSPMLNDFNQHLCGGWRMLADIPDEEEATIEQVASGRKPLGALAYWVPRQEGSSLTDEARIRAEGLVVFTTVKGLRGGGVVRWITVCRDIRLGDIGDLEDLARDYAGLVEEDITAFATRRLSSFLDNWDYPGIPLWLAGLVLGYPVENTISILRQ